MSSDTTRISHLVESERANRTYLDDPAPPSPLGFATRLLGSQRRFVLWHVVFLFMHFAELLVLAAVHRVYFPPESLFLLRICSSLSLFAVIVSLSLRIASPPPIDGQTTAGRRSDGFRVARLLFQCTLGVCFGMLCFMAMSNVSQFSSPPIFRALVFSILITLPFDCMCAFAFLNQRAFPRVLTASSSRYIALGGDFAALLCLYYNLPALCLLVRTLPRIFVAFQVWTGLTGLRFSELFEVRLLHDRSERQAGRYAIGACGSSLVAALVMELSLYLTFWSIKGIGENIALIVFFCHKIIHLGHSVLLRLALQQRRAFSMCDVTLSGAGESRLLRRLVLISVVGIGIALMFSPIIVLQKEYILWSSHLGEQFSWSVVAWGALVALTVARIASHALVSVLALQQVSKLLLAYALAALCAFWVSLDLLISSQHIGANIERTLISAGLFDAVCQLGCVVAGLLLLRAAARGRLAQLMGDSGNARFLGALQDEVLEPSTEQVLVYVRANSQWLQPLPCMIQEAVGKRGDVGEVAKFSRHQALLYIRVRPDCSKAALYAALVARLAGNAAAIKILKFDNADYDVLFANGRSALKVAEWLVYLVKDLSGTSPLGEAEAQTCEEIVALLASGDRESLRVLMSRFGIVALSRRTHWDYSSIGDAAMRKDLARYGARLVRSDRIFDATSLWNREFKGFLHLVDEAGISVLAFLPMSLRSLKFYLEVQLLQANFRTALSRLGPCLEEEAANDDARVESDRVPRHMGLGGFRDEGFQQQARIIRNPH